VDSEDNAIEAWRSSPDPIFILMYFILGPLTEGV